MPDSPDGSANSGQAFGSNTATRLGPYELLSPIGAGGMGEVYRARDTRLGRTVAVKVLRKDIAADPERRRRFEREARAASALNHPHICTVHDVGCDQGIDFIVMEFLEGETLAERMRKGRLPLDQVLLYGAEIADALARAHRERIVHRDLKPANIMLTRSGLKLLDFGVAKLKAGAEDVDRTATTRTADTTDDGHIVGTSNYMSPEQAQGLPIDHRSDIFSLGIVLYEMATGTRPFVGPTRGAVMASIVADTPKLVTDVDPALPPELARVIRRCLQKDPEDRYHSASDLRSDLADLRENDTSDSRERQPLPVPSGRRRRVVFALFAVAVVASAVAVAWLTRSWWQRSSTDANRRETAAGAFVTSSMPTQVTAAPGWENDPALSPDGSLVAYTSNESGNADIRVIGVGGGNAVNVSNDPATDEKPAWFPDGINLAFASNRGGRWNIWKAPALGGGASLLVPDARDPAISRDGRQIAFVRPDETGTPRVMVMPFEDVSRAHFVARPADPAFEPEGDPAWSPDGGKVCYASYRSLWIAATDGSDRRQLTRDNQPDREPAWSPDGRWVYFSSFRGGVHAVWRIAVSGASPERLTGGPGPERHPSLSRDGSRLAFSTFASNSNIVLQDMVSGEARQFGTTRDEAFPALSPDGSLLVYASLSGTQGGSELWRQPLVNGWPVGDAQKLTDQPGTVSQPDFSPDGRWIAYQCALNGRSDIWTIPAAGGESIRFTDDPADDMHPAWSPDGGAIAFTSSRRGGEHVFVAPVKDGRPDGRPRQLSRGAWNEERPAWSPDGKRLAYVAQERATTAVWRVEADGARPAERVLVAAGMQYLRWDRTGHMLVIAGRWGDAAGLTLRFVDARSGVTRPFLPSVQIADGLPDTFSIGRDGRLIAFARGAFSGDIWVVGITTAGR